MTDPNDIMVIDLTLTFPKQDRRYLLQLKKHLANSPII